MIRLASPGPGADDHDPFPPERQEKWGEARADEKEATDEHDTVKNSNKSFQTWSQPRACVFACITGRALLK